VNRWVRVGSIGVLHTAVYLWVLPRMILPRFGGCGSKITVALVVLVSLVVLGGAFSGRNKS
jgi:hypothetical protein